MSKKVKVYFGFLALLAFIFTFYSSNVKAAETRFPDVKSSREEIIYLADKGIINGYVGGNFGPNDPIKRVHAVQMIIRELGVKIGDAPNPFFNDVQPGSYGYAEIAKAKQLGIISGKGKGMFDPNGTLTRGEMAKIIVEAYKLDTQTPMEDYKDIGFNHFSRPYVNTLAAHNITSGYPDGTFRPNAKLTREHFSLFMARLLNDQFRKININPNGTFYHMSRFTQSLVLINLYDKNGDLVSQGSGFITSNNLIATIFENISGGVKAEAVLSGSYEIYPLEGVVAYNEDYDVAILKPVKKIGMPSMPLAKFSSVKLSDEVAAFGFEDEGYGYYTTGQVTDLLNVETDSGDVKIIESSSEYAYDSGYYGGPLLNDLGFVIGLHSFELDDSYYAISSDYLDEMLEPYRHKKFSEIAVKKFSEMPKIDYENE